MCRERATIRRAARFIAENRFRNRRAERAARRCSLPLSCWPRRYNWSRPFSTRMRISVFWCVDPFRDFQPREKSFLSPAPRWRYQTIYRCTRSSLSLSLSTFFPFFPPSRFFFVKRICRENIDAIVGTFVTFMAPLMDSGRRVGLDNRIRSEMVIHKGKSVCWVRSNNKKKKKKKKNRGKKGK